MLVLVTTENVMDVMMSPKQWKLDFKLGSES